MAANEPAAHSVHSFPPMPPPCSGFLEGSYPVEHASFCSAVESQDPIEGLVTEAEWWASARDLSADLPPCNDPLACSKVDFASSLRTAVQSQWELDDPSELKHPWEEGVFKDFLAAVMNPYSGL